MRTAGYLALAATLIAFIALAVVAIVRSTQQNEAQDDSRDDSPNRPDQATPGPTGEEFEGDFTLGFEQSSFIPCDKPDLRYWLVWAGGVDLPGRIEQLGISGPYAEVHLSFRGMLETGSATGYGHLGRYDGQVTVTELLELTRDGKCP
jgi:hypothetical protein